MEQLDVSIRDEIDALMKQRKSRFLLVKRRKASRPLRLHGIKCPRLSSAGMSVKALPIC